MITLNRPADSSRGCLAWVAGVLVAMVGMSGCFYVCFPEQRTARDLSRFSTLEISQFSYITTEELTKFRDKPATPLALPVFRDRPLNRRFNGNIRLNGIAILSPTTAKALAVSFPKSDLTLLGIRSLTDETAAILAAHNGSLYLDGVTHVSESVAALLAEHPGQVLSLMGLANCDGNTVAILRKHRGTLLMPGVVPRRKPPGD